MSDPFEERVAPTLLEIARSVWGKRKDAEERINDTLSVGWQLWQAAPEAPIRKIGWYAVKRVASNRQHRESVRSTTTPWKPWQGDKPKRLSSFNIAEVRCYGDPARIAGFRMDFETYVTERLTERQRTVCLLLAEGNTTQEVAEMLEVTPPAISLTRRVLERKWDDMG